MPNNLKALRELFGLQQKDICSEIGVGQSTYSNYEIGIDNPLVDIAGGVKRHRITPHTCRHTFATLMKKAEGATKEKLELIGHTSPEMLMYYEDASLEEKRKITDQL